MWNIFQDSFTATCIRNNIYGENSTKFGNHEPYAQSEFKLAWSDDIKIFQNKAIT